ncbi:hypothetical protein ACWBC2_08790 [Salegentibacter agarivorans]
MKIFLPFKRELNPYLEEIISHSKNDFFYGNFSEYNSSYDIVNIHWPEALFCWFEPSEDQLKELEKIITIWKKKSLLVYTKHDFRRNKGTTANFDKLFDIIEKNTDVFIHLGKRSQDIYSKKFPLSKHKILLHPLYLETFKSHITPKKRAREKLKIARDAKVIIVPGNVRNFRERDLILKSFKRISSKKKVLIATNMRTELRWDFRGRVRLKKIFDIRQFLVKRFKEYYQGPDYLFTYDKLDIHDLSLKMSAADVVLVPRLDTLNSGIIFLGFTFRKIVVGPAMGNMEETLKEVGFPVFDPKKRATVVNALERAMELSKSGCSAFEKKMIKYEPTNIATEMDAIFSKIIEA